MNNEYIADIKLNGILELEELDQNTIENFTNEIKTLFKKYNITFNHYEFMSINKKKYSIDKCVECENITINRDENPLGINQECFFDFIYDGGMSNNKLLCEMCLPNEHRWA